MDGLERVGSRALDRRRPGAGGHRDAVNLRRRRSPRVADRDHESGRVRNVGVEGDIEVVALGGRRDRGGGGRRRGRRRPLDVGGVSGRGVEQDVGLGVLRVAAGTPGARIVERVDVTRRGFGPAPTPRPPRPLVVGAGVGDDVEGQRRAWPVAVGEVKPRPRPVHAA